MKRRTTAQMTAATARSTTSPAQLRANSAYIRSIVFPEQTITQRSSQMTILPHTNSTGVVRAPVSKDNPHINLLQIMEENFNALSNPSTESAASTITIPVEIATEMRQNLTSLVSYPDSANIVSILTQLTPPSSASGVITLTRAGISILLNAISDTAKLWHSYLMTTLTAGITFLTINTQGYRSIPSITEIVEIANENTENAQILEDVMTTDPAILGVGQTSTEVSVMDSGIYSGQDAYPTGISQGTATMMDEALDDLCTTFGPDSLAAPIKENELLYNSLTNAEHQVETIVQDASGTPVLEITTENCTIGGTLEEIESYSNLSFLEQDWTVATTTSIAVKIGTADTVYSRLGRTEASAKDLTVLSTCGGWLNVRKEIVTLEKLNLRTGITKVTAAEEDEDPTTQYAIYDSTFLISVTEFDKFEEETVNLGVVTKASLDAASFTGIVTGRTYSRAQARSLGSFLSSAWNKMKQLMVRHPKITNSLINQGVTLLGNKVTSVTGIDTTAVQGVVANGLGALLTGTLRSEVLSAKITTTSTARTLLTATQQGLGIKIAQNIVPALAKIGASSFNSNQVSGITRENRLTQYQNIALEVASLLRS